MRDKQLNARQQVKARASNILTKGAGERHYNAEAW